MPLTLVLGPMFAEKTLWLIARGQTALVDPTATVIAVAWDGDDRYRPAGAPPALASRGGAVLESGGRVTVVRARRLADVRLPEGGSLTILIDEGQFYPDLDIADEWAARHRVAVAALASDFRREPFPGVARLLARCDGGVFLLRARCDCGEPASFTRRKGGSTEVYLIGGDEAYAPSCRTCLGGPA